MSESVRNTVPNFETSNWYAPFTGWLLVPTIMSLFTFLGSIIMIVFVNPKTLQDFELAIYAMDAFNFVYLLITYFFWIRRKKLLPKLMIGFFGIMSLWFITMYAFDKPISYINLVMAVGWIVYFVRSERVKQTFIR